MRSTKTSYMTQGEKIGHAAALVLTMGLWYPVYAVRKFQFERGREHDRADLVREQRAEIAASRARRGQQPS